MLTSRRYEALTLPTQSAASCEWASSKTSTKHYLIYLSCMHRGLQRSLSLAYKGRPVS